jgi:hypothetical protein
MELIDPTLSPNWGSGEEDGEQKSSAQIAL